MFFSLFFFTFAFAQTPPAQDVPNPTKTHSLLEALLAASPIVQLTFLILLVMSIVSWAVIFQKGVLLKKVQESNKLLDNIFLKYHSFKDIYSLTRSNAQSPLARIFSSGYEEMTKILNQQDTSTPSLGEEDNIERALRKEIQIELSYIESGLGFLATAGSSCPFIGLFGTVFGIMDSFGKIASTGSASLTVVAPGISEALLATGLGLFAAIPASIFYNLYINRLKLFEMEFNNFSSDFINIAKRNFFKQK